MATRPITPGNGVAARIPLPSLHRPAVLRRLAHGFGEVIGCRTYEGLCPHLQGLWNYACESFKLLSRTAVYDPFWSLISQDARVQVECDPLIERTEYRRYYKTAKGFSGRNCEMFLGQFVSLIARSVSRQKAIESARKLEFWHVIEDHYLAKGWTRRDLKGTYTS